MLAVILQSLPCLLVSSLGTGRLTVSNVRTLFSQVVSLRSKDRFQEQEVGLVTVPLQDVVESEPQYFRCRDTGKVRDNTSCKLFLRRDRSSAGVRSRLGASEYWR